MKKRVEQALEEVRPMLKIHAGSVELVSVNEETGVVRVKMLGTCDGCALADMTLKMGIEVVLKEHVPEVTSVERV
ncbi:NifU family protein [Candidatus Uhrbacteria bacterium]|nr:NifU family protein [Candidatus Uhrbacteria bacterium]